MAETDVIRTPDQRVRVFVSSTLRELAAEREAVRDSVTSLRLVPVMFELGARPYPPRPVYRAYIAQSQVFVGIYWQSYGWVAPGEEVSGLEDEYLLSAGLPRLVYVKSPAPDREPRLAGLLARIRDEGGVSYQHFADPAELQRLVGARDLPERQRTLRNTLDWSYGLLSASEQALFARLGVFAGPLSLPAAEAVGADASDQGQAKEPGPVLETLGALVDSSLVQADIRGGEPRFSLLETIREYALERLAAGGDWVQAHDQHATYFQALAEPAAAELTDPGQLTWLDRLEAEHDDLLAAMSWLVDQGPPERALRLFSATWRFWWLRGHAAEFTRLGEQIVVSSERLPPQQRIIALSAAGFILISKEDQAKAETLFGQNLELYRQVSDKLGVVLTATVLGVLGYLAALRRDYPRATDLLSQSQALLREVRDGDLTGYDHLQHLLTVALVDNFLGQIRLSQGDNDTAAQLITDGLTVARRAQDPISLLISLYGLALTRQAQGDLAGAAGHLKEGLALAAEAGDETSAAYYLEGLAAVAGQQDNPQRAVRLLAASRSLLEAKGSGWLHAVVPRVPRDDAVLEALRSRMGDAAFEEAQAWGASTGSRRVREYALE
jgi:tetratricopeptide (TPR) repeat protein